MLKTQPLPKRLHEARARQKHSQAEAARAMGVSVDALRKWEQGTRIPTGLYRRAVQDYINQTREKSDA